MSSRFPEPRRAPCPAALSACLLAVLAVLAPPAAADPAAAAAATPADNDLLNDLPNDLPLRVCADPDNLPYSSRREDGFENRIAKVVAGSLGRRLQYYWQPQQRGFVRKSIGEGHCDLFVGVPAEDGRLLTTRPYYRSSYVVVTRADASEPLRSFSDPRLPQLRIGVQLVGDDLAATPAGHALVRVGAVQKVTGYPVLGDGPAAARILRALADERMDAALVWGPQAGWLARQSALPLAVAVVKPPAGLPVPFEFSIAMGVSRSDPPLRDALDGAIVRQRAKIDSILRDFAVPRTDVEGER
jgi:mxaJ protein